MSSTIRNNRGNRKAGAIVSKYSRWVRLYTGTRNDPKILVLSDRQKWQWVCLLMVAGDGQDGTLPDAAHLAIELRITATEAASLIDDLVLAGLLDIVQRTSCGSIVVRPHNWEQRQFISDRSGADRVRLHRERRSRCNVTVTQTKRYRSDSVSVCDSATTVEQVDTEDASQEEESLPLRSVSTHEEDVA